MKQNEKHKMPPLSGKHKMGHVGACWPPNYFVSCSVTQNISWPGAFGMLPGPDHQSSQPPGLSSGSILSAQSIWISWSEHGTVLTVVLA